MGAQKTVILVDGFNLLHAVVLKGRQRTNWWATERQAEVLALVASFVPERFAPESLAPTEVIVIFDGTEKTEAVVSAPYLNVLRVQYAENADDQIVKISAERSGDQVVVVSADRALLDRARSKGAGRLSPWNFAKLCGSSPAELQPSFASP